MNVLEHLNLMEFHGAMNIANRKAGHEEEESALENYFWGMFCLQLESKS